MNVKQTTTIITVEIEVQCKDMHEAQICAGTLKDGLKDNEVKIFACGRNPKILSCSVEQQTCHKMSI